MSSALTSLDTAVHMPASSVAKLFSTLIESDSLDTFEHVPLPAQNILDDSQVFDMIIEIIIKAKSIKHCNMRDKGVKMDAS